MSASAGELEFILDTRDYFSNVSIWPQQPRDVDHRGWLGNFSGEADRAIAAQLLDSFLLISSEQANKMIASAFHSLAPERADMFTVSAEDYAAAWTEFRGGIAMTFPSRRNDPAGSGHLFIRSARSLVVDPGSQMFEPEALVLFLGASQIPRRVVFVDDFSGSGNQFTSTWLRKYKLPTGEESSFANLAEDGLIEEALFIPAIATADAKSHIAKLAPFVKVRPAHLLPTRYSARNANTSLVAPNRRDDLHDFLVRHSTRAGYTASSVYGFDNCGLALSFEHATPDNTLPIFNGGPSRPKAWRPLRSI